MYLWQKSSRDRESGFWTIGPAHINYGFVVSAAGRSMDRVPRSMVPFSARLWSRRVDPPWISNKFHSLGAFLSPCNDNNVFRPNSNNAVLHIFVPANEDIKISRGSNPLSLHGKQQAISPRLISNKLNGGGMTMYSVSLTHPNPYICTAWHVPCGLHLYIVCWDGMHP